MSDIALSTLYTSLNSKLTATHEDGFYYYPHFTGENIETKRDKVSCCRQVCCRQVWSQVCYLDKAGSQIPPTLKGVMFDL